MTKHRIPILANHGFELRACKTHEGREGLGLNADIYRDGRKVGHVLDDGNGGCFRYYWLDADRAQAERDQDAYEAMAEDRHGDRVMGPDLLTDRLFAEYEADRHARRDLKARIVLLDDGTLRTAKVKPTPATIAAAVARWPEARVLNALPPAEAVAAYVAVVLPAMLEGLS